jgi:endonuclease-3
VLLFSLDRNVCPVDTHVHRTLNRIGLIKTNSTDKTYLLINNEMPEGIAHQFHTNLIRLGREICKPANPNCAGCPLIKICEYENKNLLESTKSKKNDFMLLDSIQ